MALLLVRKYLVSKAKSFGPKKIIKLIYFSILFIGILILISIFLQSTELKEIALRSRHLIGFMKPIILIVSKIYLSTCCFSIVIFVGMLYLLSFYLLGILKIKNYKA